MKIFKCSFSLLNLVGNYCEVLISNNNNNNDNNDNNKFKLDWFKFKK